MKVRTGGWFKVADWTCSNCNNENSQVYSKWIEKGDEVTCDVCERTFVVSAVESKVLNPSA